MNICAYRSCNGEKSRGRPGTVCCAIGTNLSVATPMCTAPLTITASAGYRFKDFAKYGGIYNVIAYMLTLVGLKLFYFT